MMIRTQVSLLECSSLFLHFFNLKDILTGPSMLVVECLLCFWIGYCGFDCQVGHTQGFLKLVLTAVHLAINIWKKSWDWCQYNVIVGSIMSVCQGHDSAMCCLADCDDHNISNYCYIHVYLGHSCFFFIYF